MTRPGWVPLATFLGANALFGAGLFFHAFLYNFYLEALGHPESVMGFAAACLTAGSLVSLLPSGVAIDRLGSDRVFRFATGAAALGLALGAIVQRPLTVYGAAFLAGLGTASWRVAMGPILMTLTTPGSRSRAFSWNVALLVGSGGAWMALSGAAADWLEQGMALARVEALRVALLLGALATAGAALAFRRAAGAGGVKGTTADVLGDIVSALRETLRLPRPFGQVIPLVAVWMVAPALVLPFFNLFFLREFGLSLQRLGLVFGVAHAVTAAVVFASGEVAARLGPRRVLVGWMFVFGPLLWAMAGVTGLGPAVAVYLLQGFVSPATNPLIDQLLLEAAPAAQRGVVSSWRNAATEGGGMLGAGAGGAILDAFSFNALFVVAGSLGLVAAVVLGRGLGKLGQSPSSDARLAL